MLTDAGIKALKPKNKLYKVVDRDGMYVVVNPSGAVVFRYDYRLNGRRGDDFLMLRQFRLTADAGIGRIAFGPIGGVLRGAAIRRDHAAGPIIGGWAGRQRSGDQIGRGQDAFLKPRILEIAGLGRADRRRARDHHDFIGGRKLHDLARREQRPGRLLPRHHEMPEPRGQSVPGIVGGIAQLGRGAERVAHPLGRPFVVRGEADADVAVVEDRVVRPIRALDLVETLRDQEALEAVARHEGQGGFEKIQSAECRKLVQHQQQPMALAGAGQFLGQPPADLVEDQPNKRLGAVYVGRWHDQIERDGLAAADQIGNAPIASRRHPRHHGIAVEAEKRHGGGEHPASFVLALVQQLARRRRDDGMNASLAEMRRVHHGAQGRLDRAAGIGQEIGDARQRLVLLRIENMQDRADQQAMAGLFPMITLVEAAFGIDQNIRDVLHVADFPLPLPHLQQRIVGRRSGVRGIEQQDAAVLRAKAGRQRPVLALDVVDDAASRPCQQRRHHQPDALTAAGRREA